MASPELKTITEMLRARQEQAPADISFPESRAMFEQMTAAFPAPPGVTSTPVDAGGIPAEWIAAQIIIGGDSAGGGLAAAVLVALKEGGKPLPVAAVCISPWTDLALTGESL